MTKIPTKEGNLVTTIFTEPTIRLTDILSEATPGEYRDDCGRLAVAGMDCVHESTGAGTVSPRHSTPDSCGKLPTMTEIFTSSRMQAITGRQPINLDGWAKEEAQEWDFDPAPTQELTDVLG